ncbi:hypothetical protein N665_0246s0020 [Sinapis alba]|nr:hypothetical protein N665_0246s0020 [Sinapis alba]
MAGNYPRLHIRWNTLVQEMGRSQDGKIYKWKFSAPLMTCAEGDKARKSWKRCILDHAEHSGGRSLAVKIKHHGYYWPMMIKNCEKFTRKCEKC